jgi:hypothetical protein
MSKKNKHKFSNSQPSSSYLISSDHAAEYKVIKWDLVRLLIFNVVILAAVLALYYYNKDTQVLQELFSKYIKI